MHFICLILIFGVKCFLADTSPALPDTTPGGIFGTTVNMTLMRATMALIEAGDREIQLLETKKDLILLVGMSGSGKSTMAHLLGDQNMTLEAYDYQDDILVRDWAKDKISGGNSSLISKTLFPELILDHETGEAMYDCPGFKDTRNTSVEIANGFFMRKIVRHANSIKLLAVTKHSSVRPGELRDPFTALVKQLLQFIQNLSNYKGAIALLVTKLEVSSTDERAFRQISGFLKTSRPTMLKKFPDRQTDVETLFDSWLETDSTGKLVNLDFFRQPPEVGNFSEMPEVLTNRERIRKTVFNNTHFKYVLCNTADFGMSLSPEATTEIRQIQIKLNGHVEADIRSLNTNIQNRVKISEADSSDNLLPPQYFASLLNASGILQSQMIRSNNDSTPAILKIVVDLAKSLSVPNVVETVKHLRNNLEYIQYLGDLITDQEAKTTTEYADNLAEAVIKISKDTESNVRSRLGTAVKESFSPYVATTKITMKGFNKTQLYQAAKEVTDVVKSVKKNTKGWSNFVSNAGQIISLNQNRFNFGLVVGKIEAVTQLVELLPSEGELAERYKMGDLFGTLTDQLVMVSEHVKKEVQTALSDLTGKEVDKLESSIRDRRASIEASADSQNSIFDPQVFAFIQEAATRAASTAASDVLDIVLELAKQLGVSDIIDQGKSLQDSFSYIKELRPRGQAQIMSKHVEKLRDIVRDTFVKAELRVTSRLGPVVETAFSNSKTVIEDTMSKSVKDLHIKMINAVGEAIEECDLNALDFNASVKRILLLKEKDIDIGIKTEELQKVEKLVELLLQETEVTKRYNSTHILSTLKNQMEEVLKVVGVQAGVTDMFPDFLKEPEPTCNG